MPVTVDFENEFDLEELFDWVTVLVIAVAIERYNRDFSMELSENNDMQRETVFLSKKPRFLFLCDFFLHSDLLIVILLITCLKFMKIVFV